MKEKELKAAKCRQIFPRFYLSIISPQNNPERSYVCIHFIDLKKKKKTEAEKVRFNSK